MSLHMKNSTGWHTAVSFHAKDNGVWKPATEGWVNKNGTWEQFYPEPHGSLTKKKHGTYSWRVPDMLHSVTASVYGAGGGSGSNNSSGDAWVGSGGGSGGFKTNIDIAVTPGEILTLVVGLKGFGGSYHFNNFYVNNYAYGHGYQIVNITGTPTNTTITGLNTTTTYHSTITVNGVAYPIAVLGIDGYRYAAFMGEINTQLDGAASISIDAGNLLVESSAIGPASTISIDAGSLFTALTGYTSRSTPVSGALTGASIGYALGTAGGNTSLKRGGTVLASATGGQPGNMHALGGVGGSPNGVQGNRGSSPMYGGYDFNGAVAGGSNGTGTPPSGHGDEAGTGYGNGGGQSGLGLGCNGQSGAIVLTW